MDAIKEERFTPEQVAGAIERAAGNVTLAAKSLSTSRSTLYNYVIRYPELKQALADTRESMIDHAETALRRAAIKGEGWAVCFTLKCLGRNRGYIEKHEHEVRITDTRPLCEDAVATCMKTYGMTRDEAVAHLEQQPEFGDIRQVLNQESRQVH